MTIQTIPGGLWLPGLPERGSSSISFGDMLINTAGHQAAAMVTAPKTGTILKVGFLTGTVTTGDTVDVRLETISAVNGDPTGTLLGTNSNGSQVIGDGDDNTWFTTALTTGVVVTKGSDEFAVVIVNGSGGGNMNIRNTSFGKGFIYPGYSDLYTGSWVKGSNNGIFAFEYSDGSYEFTPGLYPISALTSHTFASDSTPDERALRFKVPWPCRVSHAWIELDADEAVDIVLYNSASSALQTVSLDKDVRETNTRRRMVVNFPTPQTLTKDLVYRLAVKPTTTTSVVAQSFDVDAVAIMDSFEGGQDFHYSERTDAGSWTDTTTRRLIGGIGIDGLDDGAGLVQSGMTGGIS